MCAFICVLCVDIICALNGISILSYNLCDCPNIFVCFLGVQSIDRPQDWALFLLNDPQTRSLKVLMRKLIFYYNFLVSQKFDLKFRFQFEFSAKKIRFFLLRIFEMQAGFFQEKMLKKIYSENFLSCIRFYFCSET